MPSELGRRLVHASGSVVPAAYLLDRYVLESGLFTWRVVQVVAVAGLVVTAVLEAARLYAGFDHLVYRRLTREYEQETVAGYALYVLGVTVVVLAFEPRVAVPAILMLALGDPISGLLSRDELRTVKSPRVLLGMFSVCFVIAYPFVPPVAAVLGAVGGTLADGITLSVGDYVVDDNLTIPFLAASLMWVAVSVL